MGDLVGRLLAVQLAFCSVLADELTIILSAGDDPEISASVQRIAWRLAAFQKMARDAGRLNARFESLTK